MFWSSNLLHNYFSANDSLLKKCLADCIRKNIPENSDLSDGILFVRAYNARRKKHTEALIVELPGPREEKLTPQKSRFVCYKYESL